MKPTKNEAPSRKDGLMALQEAYRYLKWAEHEIIRGRKALLLVKERKQA